MLVVFLAIGVIPAIGPGNRLRTITGTVVDPTGAAIPGATITVTDLSTKAQRKTVSTAEGQYVLVDIPPGTYSVLASKSGFAEDQIKSLTVLVSTQVTANFKMAIGAESTVITVEASNADLCRR